jgi:hypothetical protein
MEGEVGEKSVLADLPQEHQMVGDCQTFFIEDLPGLGGWVGGGRFVLAALPQGHQMVGGLGVCTLGFSEHVRILQSSI